MDIDEIENADDDVRDPYFQYHSASSEESDTSEGDKNENLLNSPEPEEADTFQKGRPKKGRKRKYVNQTDSTRKILKNSNQLYISKRGKKC